MTRKILLLPILLLLFACGEKKIQPSVNNQVVSELIPDQESWNSKIIFSDKGRLRAVLWANHLQVFEKKKITLLDGVKINFYDAEGKRTSTLTSKRGRVNDATKDMFAIDSVVAVNDSGVVLKTEELVWKSKRKKIVTDKFVTIDDKQEHIEGYGMEADDDLKNYTIFNVTYRAVKK